LWGIVIFTLALVIVPSLYIIRNELARVEESLKSEAIHNNNVIEVFLADEFTKVFQDIDFFARNPVYGIYLADSNGVTNKQVIEKTLGTFGQIRGLYYQIRLIDTAGFERLKIGYTDEGYTISSDLQDKGKTFYMKEAAKLQKKEVYISPLNLNRENGNISLPHIPVIRFIRPVYTHSGAKAGYVVLNYLADRIIDKLRLFERSNSSGFLLANDEGLWIKSTDPGQNFLFDKSSEKAESFFEWEEKLPKESFVYYKKINPTQLAEIPAGESFYNQPQYYSIIYYHCDYVSSLTQSIIRNIASYGGVLLIVVIPVLFFLFNLIDKKNSKLRKQSKSLSGQLHETRKLSEELSLNLELLKKKESELERAQDVANIGYYENDLVTGRSVWSYNLPRVYGLSHDYDFNEIPIGQLIVDEDLDRVNKNWDKAIKQGKAFSENYRVRNARGGIDHVLDIANPEFENGKVVKMIGIVLNNTSIMEREEALLEAKEEAEEGMKAKSNFLATMSHEIRTPLNAVIGMAGLLKSSQLTEQQKEFVETIHVSGNALLSVINDILDFSRIESGKMELEFKPFDFNRLLEEVVEVVSLEAKNKKLALYYSLRKDVPDIIYGDKVRLRQALINLVNNAIKFTHKGEVSVTAALGTKKKADQAEIIISVEDTGVGIPQSKQEKIFSAFEQADSSVTRKYGGTGLGLSITSKLVNAMGGELALKSKEGKGSTFTIKLNTKVEWSAPEKKDASEPNEIAIISHVSTREAQAIKEQLSYFNIEGIIYNPYDLNIKQKALFLADNPLMSKEELEGIIQNYKSHTIFLISSKKMEGNITLITRPIKRSWIKREFVLTEVKKEIHKEKTSLKNSKDLKILMAEDNPVNRKLAGFLFKDIGQNLEIVEDGEKAVASVQSNNYDIVFMDVQMPVMDGIEACRLIKANMGEKSPVIIALTAHAMEGDEQKFISEGMDDYISKPIDKKLLVQKIEYWASKA